MQSSDSEGEQLLQAEDGDNTENSSINMSSFIVDEPDEHDACESFSRSVEEMFIYYKHYFTQMKDFLAVRGCKIVIGTERFSIYGPNSHQIKESYQSLKEEILQKIKIIKLDLKRRNEIYIIFNSPSRQKLLKDNNCELTKFGPMTLWLSSQTHSHLEQIKYKIMPTNARSILISRRSRVNQITPLISDYLRMVLIQYSKYFQQKKVQVEFSTKHESLWVECQNYNDKKAGANTIISILEACFVLVLNDNKDAMRGKDIEKYLKEVTKVPLIFKSIGKNKYVLISKTNIVRQLLEKSKLKTYSEKCILGTYLMNTQSIDARKDICIRLAEEEGYELHEESAVYYFLPKLIREDTDKVAQEKVSFMIGIIKTIDESKTKFEFVINKPFGHQKKLMQLKREVLARFYEVGVTKSAQESKGLQSQLGCDIMLQVLHMNASHSTRYKYLDAEEENDIIFTKIDWCPAEQVKVIPKSKGGMKAGIYFYGSRKFNDMTKEYVYMPYSLLTIF